MTKSNMHINDKLLELRLRYGYSYEDMAQKLGICKAYYWQIEHGNRRVYYDLAMRISAIFKLKPDKIFYDFYKNSDK